MKSKGWMRAGALILAAMLIFGACSDDDDGGEDVEVASETSEEEVVDLSEELTENAAEAEEKGLELDLSRDTAIDESAVDEAQVPEASPSPGGETAGGFLSTLLQPTVADFTLGTVTVDQATIDAGAVEALTANYARADGSALLHPLQLRATPEEAAAALSATITGAVSGGWQQGETISLTGSDGAVLGTATVLVAPDGTQAVLWSNTQLFAGAIGAGAIDFFNSLTY